ncbi:glutathione synthase [Desertibaculum subflavum]|uniref:glutathione synthase n=1 Tax=Desertibaculum subflavum TaxID=2268458 RepID=UPI000E666190
MSLTVAIQMDPMEAVNIDGDSTFVLAMEAQARGYRLYHYLPRDMSMKDGRVTARAQPLQVRRERGNHHTFGAAEVIEPGRCDVVLLRQDPPFDMAYITTTHLLEKVNQTALVVNDPVSVRNAPEKLFVTHFPDLMPQTLISADPAEIRAFRAEHKDIILKPLYGNGGAGVFHVKPDDENLNSLLEMFTQLYREPIMVQRYEPKVREGDKRVILIDGVAAGAVNRVPAAGEARSNMHVGGKPVKSPMSKRDLEICERIGPELKRLGLVFVGIDVIGDYITEINVTSPTGLQEINRFDGVKLEAKIWDAIERRLGERKK